MNKSVLSVVVTGLLVPMVQAMDGGPPVEVELPEVAVPHVEVELPTVEVELPTVEVELPAVVELPEVADQAVENAGDPVPVELPIDSEFSGPENENAVGHRFLNSLGLGGPFAERGRPDALADEPGTPLPVEALADAEHPVIYSAFSAAAENRSEAADNRPEVGASIREFLGGGLLPNFRGGVAERGPEIPVDRSALEETPAAIPLLINNGQRGAERSAEHRAERSLQRGDEHRAERSVRSGEESDRPRTAIGRFFSRTRPSESEVTPASAIATDTALSSQLAGIDRLRDTALRTGDQKLLDKADRLEQELRAKSGHVTRIPTRRN